MSLQVRATGPGTGEVIYAHIYYDALGERVRTNEFMENGREPRPNAVEILRLYREVGAFEA